MLCIDQTFEQQVALTAHRGLARVDAASLREIADTLWHTHHIPDLSGVPAELRADAGYLIERLVRFNVLDRARRNEILEALAPWQDSSNREAASTCRDPLAQEWGASSDLTSRQLMALLR